MSDPLDTALALRALKALGHPGDARIRSGVTALRILAGPDGGWAAVPGAPTSTVVTAEVLLALLDWPELPEVPSLQAAGLAALLARQNTDGGFGASPSTAFASALALEVLLRAEGPPEVIDPWLRGFSRTSWPTAAGRAVPSRPPSFSAPSASPLGPTWSCPRTRSSSPPVRHRRARW